MKVYLSSTLNDLRPERQVVKEALGGECIVIESYGADERSLRESCLSDVESTDLYIGIVGLRYGFIPPGQALSITHLEYEKAKGRPRLLFVKAVDAIPWTLSDSGTKEHPSQLIESFREQIVAGTDLAARPAVFSTPEDLKAQVLKAYFGFLGRNKASEARRIKGPPYPGLRAFLPNETDRFFGREREIGTLLERLLARGERFLAVVGPSGCGKSSLVSAGLIPRLNMHSVGARMNWCVVTFTPGQLGADPFQALASALSRSFAARGWRVPELAARLRNRPSEITNVAREGLSGDMPDAQLLLFGDQFEEIFAGDIDDSTRKAFFYLLNAAATSKVIRMIVALRSDFYAQWPQDEVSAPLLDAGHFMLAAPRPAALEDIVVAPAQAAGLTIPWSLRERILTDAGRGPGSLALAQFALARLYDMRIGDALTEAAYDAIGCVAGAIDRLAEEAVQQLQDATQRLDTSLEAELFSNLFLCIASVDDSGQEMRVVRRRALATELSVSAHILAKYLVEKRLLVSSNGGNDGAAIYEVGHEALFSHWRRFKQWLVLYSQDLVLRQQAERAAADWEKGRRSSTLQWGWERQSPVLIALRNLNASAAVPDKAFTDNAIAAWSVVDRLSCGVSLKQFLYPEPLALMAELESKQTPHHRREQIGLRLNQLGDTRRGVGLNEDGLPDIAWIDIPAGRVTRGHSRDVFNVKRFRLARYPVTWIQYRAFLNAKNGYSKRHWWHGQPREKDPGAQIWCFDNHPAVNVSWYDALAYCRWLSVQLTLDIRLPTEWEWQWAASGGRRSQYPWSGAWNSAHANSEEAGIGRTVAVGMYPQGRSRFGLDDMVGNVSEWCLNAHHEPRNVALDGDASRTLRGGAWFNDYGFCGVMSRDCYAPAVRQPFVGFRLCCSLTE